MAEQVKKVGPGTLAKAAQVVNETVVQPVAKALGLAPGEPKPEALTVRQTNTQIKAARKASRKAAVASQMARKK